MKTISNINKYDYNFNNNNIIEAFDKNVEKYSMTFEENKISENSINNIFRTMSFNVRYWTNCNENESILKIIDIIKNINPNLILF
jgi:hypothetical protein